MFVRRRVSEGGREYSHRQKRSGKGGGCAFIFQNHPSPPNLSEQAKLKKAGEETGSAFTWEGEAEGRRKGAEAGLRDHLLWVGGYTGIKTPRGFHNQTLPLAFPLVVAGTVCRQGLCSIRDLPPRPLQGLGRPSLSLVPKVTPQTSHQEACSPLAGLPVPGPYRASDILHWAWYQMSHPKLHTKKPAHHLQGWPVLRKLVGFIR